MPGFGRSGMDYSKLFEEYSKEQGFFAICRQSRFYSAEKTPKWPVPDGLSGNGHGKFDVGTGIRFPRFLVQIPLFAAKAAGG